MATKWISVITDEAMQKICYECGGWQLTPYKYAVTETDLLKNITVVDDQGNVTDEAYEKLTSLTTADMLDDINNTTKVWCIQPFSSITKSNDYSLLHHIVIPSDLVDINKDIKTIYFQYQANNGEIFLYAVAYAIEDIIYEKGVTQSFYFNFTVSNKIYSGDTNFVINYTYPQEIADHNTADIYANQIHDGLVDRGGQRTLTGVLSYNENKRFTNNNQLVSKQYVDEMFTKLFAANPNLNRFE